MALSANSFAGDAEPKIWDYDMGPNLNSSDKFEKKMAEELVELNSQIPYFPGVSDVVMGSQKFRPAFGPISWRMGLKPNSVKILFIGQDGTHIAEAAGRPATAGFGGRAHDLANHFGVDHSAAFINTYAFTIRGQYGDRGVPYLKRGKVNFTSQFLDNELWLMSQGQNSPITIWRNKLIDWIIRNNQKSLKMIVTFGGSARDTISSYIESRPNGSVGTRLEKEDLKDIKMPEYRLQYAGGNNNFPTPIDRRGKDIYADLLGKKPNYVPPFNGRGEKDDQKIVQDLLVKKFSQVKDKMVFSNGGIAGSGLLHPAQLGGYDINQIKIGSEKRISLRGLKLSNNKSVKNDVLVVDLPHPTYLSMVAMGPGGKSKVNKLVEGKTEVLKKWAQKGWSITPDKGIVKGGKANFFANKPYAYGRGEIGQEYYDFGTPGNRMVSKSSAKRIDPKTILLGVRDDKYLSKRGKGMDEINAMKEVDAAYYGKGGGVPAGEMFISISRLDSTRTDFDPGPDVKMAKLMKTSLYGGENSKKKLETIFKARATVSHESVADFAHYRGNLQNPQVLVVADPEGWDDIITARALTGLRGQYLQGLMNAIKTDSFGIKHAVLKTVPFGMEGAEDQQWENILDLTYDYRSQVLKELVSRGVRVIITDGEWAAKAVAQIKEKFRLNVDVIDLGKRSTKSDSNYKKDMMKAFKKLESNGFYMNKSYRGERANIPSKHLSYYARVWEGTSGDRVITSQSQPGLAFAEVVPSWVVDQKPKFSLQTKSLNGVLLSTLEEACLPEPGEKPGSFLDRKVSGKLPSHCKR